MATITTASPSPAQANASAAASKPRAKRPKLDLATAKVADGALATAATVYDLIGHKTSSYRTADYGEYQRFLKTLNLADMQDHAHDVNEVPIDNYEVLRDRLERRFLEENSKFEVARARANQQRNGPPNALDPKLADFMRRGR